MCGGVQITNSFCADYYLDTSWGDSLSDQYLPLSNVDSYYYRRPITCVMDGGSEESIGTL